MCGTRRLQMHMYSVVMVWQMWEMPVYWPSFLQLCTFLFTNPSILLAFLESRFPWQVLTGVVLKPICGNFCFIVCLFIGAGGPISSIKRERVLIPLTGLTRHTFMPVPNQEYMYFQRNAISRGLFVVYDFMWEEFVRFVDSSGIVDLHCLQFLFIIMIIKIVIRCYAMVKCLIYWCCSLIVC